MKRKLKSWPTGRIVYGLTFFLILAGLGTVGFLLAPAVQAPGEREITVRAYRYGYEPEVIRVNRGDTIRLRLISDDVIHGFYLEGYDLDVTIFPMRPSVELRRPSDPDRAELVEEVVFRADREGKFRYRCSQTCGFMHPFMLGELIVAPNRLLLVSLGLALGVLLGGFIVVLVKEAGSLAAHRKAYEHDTSNRDLIRRVVAKSNKTVVTGPDGGTDGAVEEVQQVSV